VCVRRCLRDYLANPMRTYSLSRPFSASKSSRYQKFGVRYIWVIDPRKREAFIYTATIMHAVEDGVLRTSDPDIAVPLSTLFD
jgi:Uma2 family endonuclease